MILEDERIRNAAILAPGIHRCASVPSLWEARKVGMRRAELKGAASALAEALAVNRPTFCPCVPRRAVGLLGRLKLFWYAARHMEVEKLTGFERRRAIVPRGTCLSCGSDGHVKKERRHGPHNRAANCQRERPDQGSEFDPPGARLKSPLAKFNP